MSNEETSPRAAGEWRAAGTAYRQDGEYDKAVEAKVEELHNNGADPESMTDDGEELPDGEGRIRGKTRAEWLEWARGEREGRDPNLKTVPKPFVAGVGGLEFYFEAVKADPKALEYVPEKLRTARLYRIAVEQNGSALEGVPKALLSAELCRIAVEQNGAALEYVPEKLRTAELCIAAVKNFSPALQYVPEALKAKVKKGAKNEQ
jgi:tetratricopeptide (TPR) repeat protein